MSYQYANFRRAKRRGQNNDPSLSSAALIPPTTPHPTNIRLANDISDIEVPLTDTPSTQPPCTPASIASLTPRTCPFCGNHNSNRRAPYTTQSQRMRQVLAYLRQYKISFKHFMKLWATNAPSKGRQRERAEQLLELMDDNDIRAIMVASGLSDISDGSLSRLAGAIRKELDALQKNTKTFGSWDASTQFDEVDLQASAKEVQQYAPTLWSLIQDMSGNIRNEPRQDQPGRVVMIASMLGTGRARNTANAFSRCLSIYLLSSGVKRRVLTVMNGLGVCDGYNAASALLDNVADIAKVKFPEVYIS